MSPIFLALSAGTGGVCDSCQPTGIIWLTDVPHHGVRTVARDKIPTHALEGIGGHKTKLAERNRKIHRQSLIGCICNDGIVELLKLRYFEYIRDDMINAINRFVCEMPVERIAGDIELLGDGAIQGPEYLGIRMCYGEDSRQSCCSH